MTKEVVAKVIELLAQQKPYNVIARDCGVSKSEVRKIALGRRWRIAEVASEGEDRRMTLATFSERERMLWTFPCGEDKKPRNANGFLGAVQGVWWPRAKLVGVPTGNRNGFDILDIDGSEGLRWYDRNYDAIPQTRAHSTQRGMHLLFVHAPGLRCSTSEIAPGIDVRTQGGHVIWWPREGYPIEDHPLSEWPNWLLEEAMGTSRSKRNLRTFNPSLPLGESEVATLREALFSLDPCAFEHDRPRWLAFMNGARARGVPLEMFCEWTSGNSYERDDARIEHDWNSLSALHAGAFNAELKAAGIRLTRSAFPWFESYQAASASL
jgi:hypothetical protein